MFALSFLLHLVPVFIKINLWLQDKFALMLIIADLPCKFIFVSSKLMAQTV